MFKIQNLTWAYQKVSKSRDGLQISDKNNVLSTNSHKNAMNLWLPFGKPYDKALTYVQLHKNA